MSKFRVFFRPMLIASLPAVLVGCSDVVSTTADNNLILATTAEYRAITRTRVADAGSGRIQPIAVICAEPSPDVAKTISDSFSLDSKLSADVIGKGGGSAALTLASARAMAIAQMTERLATIQLLRDGMYRACEAYANGAISRIEYSVLLSRYDDTMITLLLGELAAENFGRPLARLQSNVFSAADTSREAAAKQVSSLVADKDKGIAELEAALKAKETEKAVATMKADRDRVEAEITSLKGQKAQLKSERDLLEEMNQMNAEAFATISALTAHVDIMAHGGSRNSAVSVILENMQRNYLYDVNIDSLAVACLSALNDSNPSTALATECGNGFLRDIRESNSNALTNLLSKHDLERAEETLKQFVGHRDQLAVTARAILHLDEEAPPLRTTATKRMTKRALVLAAQRALKKIGFDPGPTDGIFGMRTAQALNKYQQERNLPVNGDITVDVLVTLLADPRIRRKE